MGKGGKKKSSWKDKVNTQSQLAPAMMAPVQHLYSHLGTQVPVGHTYNVQFVVEMNISGRIVSKITSAQNVGQGHMLHECVEHQPTQVKVIIFACPVVAKNTLQVTAPVGSMTAGKSLGQCNRSDVMGNWPAVRVKRSHILGQVTCLPCNVKNVNLLFFILNIIFNCFSPNRVAVCNVNWNVVHEISLWITLVLSSTDSRPAFCSLLWVF